MEDDSNSDSDSDSNSDSDSDSNSNSNSHSHSYSDSNGNDNCDSDDSFRTTKRRKEHAKERTELKQVESDCLCSKKEQETLKHVKSRRINKKDVAEGIYGASKKEIDLLKVGQHKRHVR